VFATSAYTSAVVNGMSQAKSLAVIGTQNSLFASTQQGVALVAGAPGANLTTPILLADPNMAKVMGVSSSPSFFALEELGGGHSALGSDVQTVTSVADFQVALTPQDIAGTLELGLFLGTSTAGVTGVTIDINANGTDLFNMSFTSGAAAAQYFTDNPVNLGQLDSSLYAGGVLNLQSEVTVTGTAGGFWGGLLVSG